MNAMCNFFKKQGQYQSTAKVVDGNLILTLPDALNPVIWRMELGNVKSSALEIRSNDNLFVLALKTPKGDVHDIAPFENRERALHALMQVSDALGKAGGKMGSPSATPAYPAQTLYAAPTDTKSSGAGYKWLAALGAVIVLIFLFSYVSGLSPEPQVLGTVTDSSMPSANQGESGVPLSADDVLRGF